MCDIKLCSSIMAKDNLYKFSCDTEFVLYLLQVSLCFLAMHYHLLFNKLSIQVSLCYIFFYIVY